MRIRRLGGRRDLPHALGVGGVVARVVGGLDVACVVAKLAAAVLVFTVRDVGGAVEVGAGVARAGDAMVLAELGLVGAHGAADAPVGGGVVVVARRAVHFGLTVLEGGCALMLGEQPPSAGEAACAPRLGLVGAHGAGLAGPETVGGEEAWRALASTFGYVAGTSQAEPVAAGASRAAELAVPVLVGPRRAWHTLAGLSAEVGTGLAGHAFAVLQHLAGATRPRALEGPGWPLGHLVLGACDLDGELLPADGLAESLDGSLQALLRPFPHTVGLAGV